MKNKLWSRFLLSKHHRKDLDQLLNHVPGPNSKIKVRISWFFDILEWIRREGLIKKSETFQTGETQAKRVQYFLSVLERNEEWKKNVAKTFRSIMRDTRGLEMFLETGVSSQTLATELVDRLQAKILPAVPKENELSYILSENFQHERDIEWLRQLDSDTVKKIEELLNYDVSPDEKNWNRLKEDACEALALLVIQMQGLGVSSQIRQRLTETNYQKIPFYVLGQLIEKYVQEKDETVRYVLGEQAEKRIDECYHALAEVQQHLDDYGVSIQIVFQIEKIESLLSRIERILCILQSQQMDPEVLSRFLEKLVSDSIQRRSLLSLANQNFSLLARKIVERTAETGEHYITRTVSEYRGMINKALGGGLITAFTTVIKFVIYIIESKGFLVGLLASLNYSLSFLLIHFTHCTLATKQSALTAPALASKMAGIENKKALDDLVDEIVNTIRTQVSAIIGNILGVVPLTLLICFLIRLSMGREILNPDKADVVVKSFSLLGPTPLYAAFTGVLLWGSSLIAGWVDNWYAYHRLSPAIAHNRRLIFIFGESRMRAFSIFLKKNIVGIAGNVSLGFLLGLLPLILHFMGIPLDIRHVTLSSGALAAATWSLGFHIIESSAFWLAVSGIIVMGALNVLVSFFLALFLAIRARKIQAPERELIYKALIDRLRYQPLSFFWPTIKA